MPDAPPPPGGIRIPRDDDVRWVEPAAPAFIEPDQDISGAPTRVAGRDAVRWREVRWVDFVGSDSRPPGDQDETWSGARVPGAVGDAEAWQERGQEPGDMPLIGPEDSITPISRLRTEPASAPPIRATPRQRRLVLPRGWSGMRRRGAVRLSRVAQFSIALVALAVILGLSYEGGERLAGLAGAMTPPRSSAARPRTPQPPTAQETRSESVDEAGAHAAALLERASAGDTTAQYNVAVLYARGEGLVRDYTSAAGWFQKAAAAGNPSAQFNLGVLYQRGLGVSQDSIEALRWYKRAAERHYAPAEYNLAIAYAEGQGTPPDSVAAARWYHQAAVQGLVQAMINFAIQYEKGEGVEKSPVDAYAWYWAAAQRGDAVAEKRAAELLAGFDAAARKQARLAAGNIGASIRQEANDGEDRNLGN